MKRMTRVPMLVLVGLGICGGCSLHERPQSALHPGVDDPTIPNEWRGISASIRSVSGTTLGNAPLRIEHVLKNTTDKPLVVHDLSVIIPCFEGEWGGRAGGPGGATPDITLAPGQSISNWVELARSQPDRDGSFSVTVRAEGAPGLQYVFDRQDVPPAIRFRVAYDDMVLTGQRGNGIAPVLATPWIDIQVK